MTTLTSAGAAIPTLGARSIGTTWSEPGIGGPGARLDAHAAPAEALARARHVREGMRHA